MSAAEPEPEIVLHVCVTCRNGTDDGSERPRPGARLHAALHEVLAERPQETRIRIEAVECLSVCKRPCTVAVSSPGRWTYVYGDLDPEISAETVLQGIGLYAGTPDGIVPWRERPEAFRKGVVARIPPLNPSVREAAE